MCRWVMGMILYCLLIIPGSSVAEQFAPESASESASSRTVPVLAVSGAIGPAVSEYLINEIRRANQQPGVPAVIITLDTPGGLVSSLRDINQQILASDVPVLCLVYPQGARAASAGTFILYACHIAAMSPATTLGAATPVNIGGGTPGGEEEGKEQQSKEPSAMEKKVLNDSVAYIRSLAQLRGRNVEWAEKAVTEAATLSSSEALEMNVINLIAESPQGLLAKLEGQSVTINEEPYQMAFDGAELDQREPDWRNKFLSTITDPNIAYILMIIGIYGLLLEFYSPGFGIAGIMGAICLLIAMYAFQMLPVNYVGVGLMLVGIALLIAESMVPSFGLFGFGGIVAFVLGSLFLIDSDLPELQVSMNLIYSIALVSAAFVVFVLRRIWMLRKKQVVSGLESVIGTEVLVIESAESGGFVLVDGERWSARADGPLQEGETVVVGGVDGLTLLVKKLPGRKENG